jgi:transcriptional regulator with XRE-family HTH domain
VGDRLLERFGERVRELRTRAGYSQESLAEASDLHRTYVGDIERGERNVSLVNIAAIARALEVSVSELVRGVDAPRQRVAARPAKRTRSR